MSIKPAPPRRSNSRRQTGAPTISDVARLAQVSPMTVSRVINGEGNVRATTRTAVQAAITALNYSPNQSARSLARAGQLRLGLLCSNPSDAYLSAFLLGSLEQASRSNIQLIVQKCELDDHEQEVVARLIASGVDGIILPPPLCDAPLLLDMLRDAAMPAMVIATSDPQAGFGAVSIGDHAAACEMTQHLLALGHQRIGFITGNPNLTASGERLAGYRAALEGRGITFDAGLVAHGLFTYRSGLDAAEELLDRDDPPTAVFASNDDMAAAAVAMAHRRGLDVPGDLTVVGFDDSAIARMIWPELTTIHQPIAEMSRTGVELLAGMLRDRRNGGNAEPQHLVLDYTLIRRQSDAAPRQRPKARRWG